MVNLEVKKVENVTLSKDFIDLRKNVKYKDPKITNNIKQNRVLRKQALLEKKIQNVYIFMVNIGKGLGFLFISLGIILLVGNNFNFKFDIANAIDIKQEYTEKEVDKEMDKIIDEVLQPEENIKDYKEEFQEDVKQEILEKKKEERKIEIKKVEKPVEVKKESIVAKTDEAFDIDKLAKAVALQETADCTKGYGKTHNNCFGIKHGNTVPCPGVPKMAMCKFKTKEESYEAFKIIWTKWYGELPTRQNSVIWTGNDRPDIWRNAVLHFYNNDKI